MLILTEFNLIVQVMGHAGDTVMQALRNNQVDRATSLIYWTIEFLEDEDADLYVGRDGGWVSCRYKSIYYLLYYLFSYGMNRLL